MARQCVAGLREGVPFLGEGAAERDGELEAFFRDLHCSIIKDGEVYKNTLQ